MSSVSSSTSVQARQQWRNTEFIWFPTPGQQNKHRTIYTLTNYGLLTYKLSLCWPKEQSRHNQVLGLRPYLLYQNQMALVNYASISDGLMLSQCLTRFQCPAFDALLDRLGGAVFMTKLDMTKAYFQEDYCKAYLDDVMVFSRSWEDHLNHLHNVFVRVHLANLSLNIRKCEFANATLDFLGHTLSLNTVRPHQQKVDASA